jgi:hypothetical protein
MRGVFGGARSQQLLVLYGSGVVHALTAPSLDGEPPQQGHDLSWWDFIGPSMGLEDSIRRPAIW